MDDLNLRSILKKSRRLQEKHYSDDEKLESHLAQGLIKNAANLIDPSWSTGFMDMDQEHALLDRERLLNAVDCLLYSTSILSIQSIGLDDLLRVVRDRQKMVADMHEIAQVYRNLPDDSLITVLDIDGVIFPYPEPWLRFEAAHDSKGFSREKIKELYRLSGLKASEPPLPHAPELIQYLQDQGCVVILLSSRPVNLYPEVYQYTLEFLDRYHMKPDLLFFKDHKAISAELETLWNRVIFFVDDDGSYLSSVKKRHPDVCCVHLTPEEPEILSDYHFKCTQSFYEELTTNVKFKEKYNRN